MAAGRESIPRWARAAIAVALLAAAGWAGVMYGFQLVRGLAVTGLGVPVSWGLYFINFVFSIGVSVAATACAAILYLLDDEELGPLALIADLVAVVFLGAAVLFITMDLGRPDRAFFILLHASPASMLFWDVAVIGAYGLLCAVNLYFGAKAVLLRRYGASPAMRILALGRTSAQALETDRRLLRGLSWISLPVAVATCSVEAWGLGLVAAQPGWNTAILPPIFIASGVVSGVAVAILAAMLCRALFAARIEAGTLLAAGRTLGMLVPVLAYLLLCELLNVAYAGGPKEQDVLGELIAGRFAGFFWFDVFGCILVPAFLLLIRRLRTLPTLALACALLVVGVLDERAWIVLPSLMRPNQPLVAALPAYRPSLAEWSIMAGIYALGLLGFLILATLFFGLRGTPAPAEGPATETVPAGAPEALANRHLTAGGRP